MLKNYYRKIEKKKDNDMDADVAQREHSNIKRYASAFSNIQIWVLQVVLILGIYQTNLTYNFFSLGMWLENNEICSWVTTYLVFIKFVSQYLMLVLCLKARGVSQHGKEATGSRDEDIMNTLASLVGLGNKHKMSVWNNIRGSELNFLLVYCDFFAVSCQSCHTKGVLSIVWFISYKVEVISKRKTNRTNLLTSSVSSVLGKLCLFRTLPAFSFSLWWCCYY